MLILVLLGMYFDDAVVFVTKSSLFSDCLWPYCGPLLHGYRKKVTQRQKKIFNMIP